MIMQAKCPGCREILRIPADWMHQPIRCKHCGMIVQLQQKPAAPPVGRAQPAAVPMGQAVMAGGFSAPAAIRAPAGAAAPPPPPAAIRMNPASRPANPRQKFTFVAVWLCGIAAIVAAAFVTTQMTGGQKEPEDKLIASVDPVDEPKTITPATPKDDPDKPPEKPNLKMPGQPKRIEPPKPPEPPKGTPLKVVPRPPDSYTKTMPLPPQPRPPLGIRPPQGTTPTANTPAPAPAQTFGAFPRRLLAINVNHPLFFNSLNYGPGARNTSAMVGKLASALQVPSAQIVELSDSASPPRPPLKPLVEKAIADFLGSSRPQDRVMLLFSGHAVEVEDVPFLVPLEGELGDKDTLIALSWLYEQLSKCRARQKVLIVDVCRNDPGRGVERPSSGAMGEKLDAALAKPPAGVQVWTSCIAGQFSYEEAAVVNSGLFFNALFEESAKLGPQRPTDTIPLDELNKIVSKRLEADVELFHKQKQTPRLSGTEITEGAAPYNEREAAPTAVKINWGEGDIFGAAKKEDVKAILEETSRIPPVKILRDGDKPIRPETFPIFAAAVLKDYKVADNEKTPLREAVTNAIATLEKHKGSFQEVFAGNNVEELKKVVQAPQKTLATTKLELEEALEQLTEAGKQLEEEKNKRWQANYQYVTARVKQRLAYVFEYQYMLAEIRTDALPERQKEHTGWRLASREKMQCKGPEGKEAKKHADDAKKILVEVTDKHKGTPWEILAKRESVTALGLEWQPTRESATPIATPRRR